jgi:Ca-activated chloride channel homolog
VLSDLKLEFKNITVTEVYPRVLGDLFRGSQLTVVGRYSGSGEKAIILSGVAAGENQQFTYEANFAEEDRAHEFIPRFWATRKIGYLVDEIRLHGENKELKDEVVRLSRKFGILTPYTSFLVTEDIKLREQRGLPPPSGPPMPVFRDKAADMSGAAAGSRAESGNGAVTMSRSAEALKSSAGAAAPEEFLGEKAREAVVQLGPRTYYKRDNVWVVSSYEKQTTIKVKYLSDEYFDLAKKNPQLARAFALGDRVIAEADGKYYELE